MHVHPMPPPPPLRTRLVRFNERVLVVGGGRSRSVLNTPMPALKTNWLFFGYFCLNLRDISPFYQISLQNTVRATYNQPRYFKAIIFEIPHHVRDRSYLHSRVDTFCLFGVPIRVALNTGKQMSSS